MKTFLLVVGALLIGAGVGYKYNEILPSFNSSQVVSQQDCSQPFLQGLIQYELSTGDIEKLSEKLAPAVVNHMIASGISIAGTSAQATANANDKNQQNPPQPKKSANDTVRAETYSQAISLVDKMIANRQVSQSQLNELSQSLADSNQPEKIIDLHSRISAAVNRGELTLKEAGRLPPGLEK